MRNFHDTFETYKRSFICAFSICMTVPLRTHLRTAASQCVDLDFKSYLAIKVNKKRRKKQREGSTAKDYYGVRKPFHGHINVKFQKLPGNESYQGFVISVHMR